MAEASTFASPVSAPAPSSGANASTDSTQTASSTAVADLLYTYEDEVKRPYVADYLGVTDVWDKEPTLEKELRGLESYLREMVVSQKIGNSTQAAKQFLEHMEKSAGIQPFDNPTRRIAKLTKYIEFRKVIDG